ncbi:MAG: glycosyltransferase [Candidatus Hadarchaeales archaeon]
MKRSSEKGDEPYYPLSPKFKISIIIPTLNEEKFIEETLINARRVVPEAEVIVSDGGSTDRTLEIAKKYAKICSGKGNVGRARNRGAKVSSGDILIFLDADTMINRLFVDRAIEVLKDPKIVGAGGLIMPSGTNLLEETVFYFFNLLIMISFLIGHPNIAGTCVAYKRRPFMEVNGFDETMVASEDFDLCKRISKKGRVSFLREVVVKTSRRRLRKMGLGRLILDWGRVTYDYFVGKKVKYYEPVRE